MLRRVFTLRKRNFHTLPAHVDAVVIGGGCIGSALCYNLQKLGVTTTLVEANELTSGTTWHTAGMLWRVRPSWADVELHTKTRELCNELEENGESGIWNENGGLYIASNTERMREYERLHDLGNVYDINTSIVTPQQVSEIHPLLNVDDIMGGLYSPTDGTIDPHTLVTQLAQQSRKNGATIMENTSVTGFVQQMKNGVPYISGVNTTKGLINTTNVINATGAWGSQISKLLNLQLPLIPIKHAYIVTDKLNGMKPSFPNVRDHDLSIYLKTQGEAMAIGGYEKGPDLCPDSNSFQISPYTLYDLNWDTFSQNFEGHMHRCPSIENVGVQSTVCGPESFTPDHKALVGPDRDIKGLWHCCGFNSMGMMMCGGITQQLAEWIVNGSPTIDIFSYDPARFHKDVISNNSCVLERTHESYAKTYSIPFKSDEPLAGRNIRKSALHKLLLEQGCVYQSRHGFERPGWFKPNSYFPIPPYDYYGAYETSNSSFGHDIPITKNTVNPYYAEIIQDDCTFGFPQSFENVAKECYATRNGIAIFDQSYLGNFILKGTDATDALQYMCTSDFSNKELGSITYTTMCNERGGVEADLTVTKMGIDEWYICSGGVTQTKDYHWILDNCSSLNCNLLNVSDDTTVISVQGPHSRALLSEFDNNLSNLPFSMSKETTISGKPVRIMRITFVGELGYEIHTHTDHACEIYNDLFKKGAEYSEHSGIPFQNAGYNAMDSLSAEKGYRHWHGDLSYTETPLEAGIGFTVLSKLKNTTIEFKGRHAIETKREAGLRKRIATFVLEDPSILTHGEEPIFRNDACVGFVRSSAFGHTLGKSVVTGYVTNNGERVKVDWLNSGEWKIGNHDAKLHLKPAYDPTNEKITS